MAWGPADATGRTGARQEPQTAPADPPRPVLLRGGAALGLKLPVQELAATVDPLITPFIEPFVSLGRGRLEGPLG